MLSAAVAVQPCGVAAASARHARHAVHHTARKHTPRPVQTPRQILAVPSGSIAAHSLLMPDQPYPLGEWDGTPAGLREQASLHTASWLAVMMDDTTLYEMCRDGVVQTLPALPDGHPAGASPCGIPAGEQSIVLAWDRTRLGDTAPNWSDFWDIARHPGKRALQLDPRGTLEIALMADGVAANDVYTVLSSPAGIDRAFRKLDQLRPYLVWWRTGNDASRIMSSGAALMLSTPHDMLATPDPKTSFSAQWRQSLHQKLSWVIPHNVSTEQAGTVIRMLRDQTPLHDDTQDAPQDGRDTQTLALSDSFWIANHDTLQKRFQSWLTTKP